MSGSDAPGPAVAKGRLQAVALESPAYERERCAEAGRREGPPASGGPEVNQGPPARGAPGAP